MRVVAVGVSGVGMHGWSLRRHGLGIKRVCTRKQSGRLIAKGNRAAWEVERLPVIYHNDVGRSHGKAAGLRESASQI
jgi:hypothetical protein